jgi:LysM repeat protein
MAKLQIKLLIFLLTMGFAAGCAAVAFWIYEHQIKHVKDVTEEIKLKKGKDRKAPDPGIRRFVAATDLIRQGQIDGGKEALLKLLQQFPSSAACIESKRIIGEIHMDALYARDLAGGKKEYTVQPGDNLVRIVSKTQTTFEALARINALTSINLQPGDKMFVIPMDFQIKILAGAKKLWILRQGSFFKEYEAVEVKLQPNVKIPATRDGVELEVGSKSAVLDNKTESPVSASFLRAEKRIILNRPKTESVALVIRTVPMAKALPVDAPAKGAAPDDAAPAVQYGVFLSPEDIEEIYPLFKRGSKVNLVP